MSSYRNYYDSPAYGKNRETSRTSSISSDRPATVTAKYTSTPSYKSSSIPVLNDTRSTREETPISTIANRYASYNKTTPTDKPISKYEKKDYSKLAIPSINMNRSRDVSPVSKYSINRTSRHTSPERRTTKSFKDKSQDLSSADRDKDIPIKTDKTSNYSSLSNYKIYPRTPSYSKPSPIARVESKPEVTVNRYAIANRLASSSYLRSPTPIKRTSVSPINHLETIKTDTDKHKLAKIMAEEKTGKQNDDSKICSQNGTEVIIDDNDDIEKIAVITRHTSPTPPGSSAYVRMRRADMAKTVEKIITRTRKRPEMIDKEIQSDRLDDPTRTSRFGSTSRTSVTNWTYYSPNSTNYTGYAGRYSTQYSNLRENERSSRSRSKEPVPVDNKNSYSNIDENDTGNGTVNNHLDENIRLEQTKDTSEIIINVNLKLKKSNSSQLTITPTELLPPEITIANNHQLPPQPPKSENVSKIKKVKVRKSSTDSSSDSTSSKKVVKKRSKSASSTDSEQNSEKGNKLKDLSKANSKGLSKTSSTINVPNGISKLKYSKARESNSPESSVTLSTQSSISEDETVQKSKTNDVFKSNETATSNENTNKHVLKTEGTEEAKSFLIRALAPVTNLFKLRHQDSSESCRLIENAEILSKDSTNITDNGLNKSKNVIASNDEALVKLKAIRPLETNDQKVPLKLNCFTDDEKPWWLDSNANIPEGIERLSPPRKSSSDSDKSEKFNLYKIKQNESGDRKDWKLASNDNVISINKQDSQNSLALSKSGSDQRNFQLSRIRHIESGERPWWLSSSKNIPEGIEKLPTPPPQPDSDSSDSEEVEVYVPSTQVPPFPLQLPDDEPLGDRRSPEGLETPNDNYRIGRRSPYENNRHYRRGSLNVPYQKGAQKYISRYTDIDDILGTSGQIYSPFMDSILARRTGQLPFDDDECEEIDPTQVRIHDSTAQMPIIKKLRCRSEIIDYRNEDQLDDVTFQVFKDGEYGAYLDLDLSLSEQQEEIEGLEVSRKNALVLRTQLSVRVDAIIEKLLHAEGRELRRALFTLKQILQQDKDLVHEFVANKGLDCLMQVADNADHNYLDYILRALGQILLYVDGMHGVMKHKKCIQWLYSLISSRFRHVVKTALKLLLVFVEYAEKNCLMLITAIHTVDSEKERPPWFNIMKILQDFDASDAELLIYATTLINRCLNNVSDRSIYYDQVDVLQDQGIDETIQLYMSKKETDLDLLRQLQIFEAVLMFEDGDESGIALKDLDESLISCVMKRSLDLKTPEQRKSKKRMAKENGSKGYHRYTTGIKQRMQGGSLGHSASATDTLSIARQLDFSPEPKDDREILLNREHIIKDLTQRLTSTVSPSEEKPIRVSEMAGIVSKAKEELAKSKSKEIVKSPSIEKSPKTIELKASENDLHWEELKRSCKNRDFHLCDLDFSDLRYDSDEETEPAGACSLPPPPPTLPPPPPDMLPGIPPPMPSSSFFSLPKRLPSTSSTSMTDSPTEKSATLKKNKKTVKLFWREIQENPAPPLVRPKVGGFIWDDLPEVSLDTNTLEHLFEARTNDLVLKEKLMEPKRNLILDTKRSNAISIAMKKLPTPQTIKVAIMKMDATVIGREGIEKLLTMLPTQEEKLKIQEAQFANPDLPLGSAEQFLLTLASINELPSRLKLWVFKLDFDNLEKEIAEPLMDLKQGIELLKANKTFKVILSTLRSVGSFLNGTVVKGFRLEYLSKVMEVKDTVHKHPLLYHICEMIIEKFPDTTDFFSEVGPVIRASKVDFDILSSNLSKLEADCKASWDHMKRVAKHDGSQMFKTKMNEFLTDAAERIILLSIVKKRVMNRYIKFLFYLGVPICDTAKTKPSDLLKVIAEFALEFRTTRERVLLQLEKRANHRERNKTRGKMIIDVGNYVNKCDATADSALKELLKSRPDTDMRRKPSKPTNGEEADEDELLVNLVRAATSTRRTAQRERRRNRLADRMNLNRTLDGHQSWPGKQTTNGPPEGIQQSYS